MLDSLIRWSLHNRAVILLLTAVLLIWGGYSIRGTPLDVLPDLTAPTVTVLVEVEGRRGGGRRAIVNHSSNGLFAIRESRWKLILGLGSGGFTPPTRVEPKPGEPAGQLYDLRKDPGETTNLYARQPEIVARLTRQLEAWQRNGRSR